MTTNAIPDVFPEVSGSNIVWQTYDLESSAEIFRYNLQASTLQQVTSNSSPDTTPQISGRNVVWNAFGGGGSYINIGLRNLDTGVTSLLTNSTLAPESYGNPKIEGQSIAWYGGVNGFGQSSEIYYHDLATGLTSRVTNNTFREQDVDVFGANVVFRREPVYASNVWDVYLATPVPEPSTLALAGLGGIGILVGICRKSRKS